MEAKEIIQVCLFMLIGVLITDCRTLRFKDSAVQYIEAGFKTVRRAGGTQKDFTKIEITAKPLEMMEDSTSIDKNRVSVETQAGERGLVVNLTLLRRWIVESHLVPSIREGGSLPVDRGGGRALPGSQGQDLGPRTGHSATVILTPITHLSSRTLDRRPSSCPASSLAPVRRSWC